MSSLFQYAILDEARELPQLKDPGNYRARANFIAKRLDEKADRRRNISHRLAGASLVSLGSGLIIGHKYPHLEKAAGLGAIGSGALALGSGATAFSSWAHRKGANTLRNASLQELRGYSVPEAFGNVAKKSLMERVGPYLKNQGKQFLHMGPAVVASDLAFGVGGAAIHDRFKNRKKKTPPPTKQQLGYALSATGIQAKLGRGIGALIRRKPKPSILSHMPHASPSMVPYSSFSERFRSIPARPAIAATALATGLGAGAYLHHKDEIASAGIPHNPTEMMQHPMVRAIMEEAEQRVNRTKEKIESVIPGAPKTYRYKRYGLVSGLKKAGLAVGAGVAADRFLIQPALNKAAVKRVRRMQVDQQN